MNNGFDFEVTTELREWTETFLLAKGYAELVRGMVDEAKQQVIDTFIFEYRDLKSERRQAGRNGRITDIKDDWLMDDYSFQVYMGILHCRFLGWGFELPDIGYCPALMAENDLRETKRGLLNAAAYLTAGRPGMPEEGITHDLALQMDNAQAGNRDHWPMQTYNKIVDMTVSLVLGKCPDISAERLLSNLTSRIIT